MWKFLTVQPLRTLVYHPQANGLEEQFNETLKRIMCKFVGENGKDWLVWLPFILFAVRVPQDSTGFSQFELLYGRHPEKC